MKFDISPQTRNAFNALGGQLDDRLAGKLESLLECVMVDAQIDIDKLAKSGEIEGLEQRLADAEAAAHGARESLAEIHLFVLSVWNRLNGRLYPISKIARVLLESGFSIGDNEIERRADDIAPLLKRFDFLAGARGLDELDAATRAKADAMDAIVHEWGNTGLEGVCREIKAYMDAASKEATGHD